ncbi:hypothetical protein [Sphingobium nicotianae]|uniref:PEP-CTERM sorting domain-containing protein n=1 Tax=Sphingobium nicotianae TaxID=2782607 RepID=A0A9X1DEJ6_9SPHN|nr:hypothetical protein [Sphingobium nicotianae]MBT2188498.1 hypothetical protein [Sphingobium nicotianae]
MLKIALKLAAAPALMLAAMPAHAADTLSNGLTTITPDNPFAYSDVAHYDWISKRDNAGQLVLYMIDLDNPVLGRPQVLGPTPGRGPAAGPVVTIMPEPMTWALMITGLTAVGWSLRSLHRRGSHPVSFV